MEGWGGGKEWYSSRQEDKNRAIGRQHPKIIEAGNKSAILVEGNLYIDNVDSFHGEVGPEIRIDGAGETKTKVRRVGKLANRRLRSRAGRYRFF